MLKYLQAQPPPPFYSDSDVVYCCTCNVAGAGNAWWGSEGVHLRIKSHFVSSSQVKMAMVQDDEGVMQSAWSGCAVMMLLKCGFHCLVSHG